MIRDFVFTTIFIDLAPNLFHHNNVGVTYAGTSNFKVEPVRSIPLYFMAMGLYGYSYSDAQRGGQDFCWTTIRSKRKKIKTTKTTMTFRTFKIFWITNGKSK